jgi:hypothetical protein
MAKTIISAEQNTCQAPFLALNQRCTEGSGLFYAIFSTLRESRRTPNPALASVRSKVLRLHACRLDFGALRLLQQWGYLTESRCWGFYLTGLDQLRNSFFMCYLLRRTDFDQRQGFSGAGVHTRWNAAGQLLVDANVTRLHGSIFIELGHSESTGFDTGFTTGAQRFVY